jgi:hypothetical protein
MRKGGKMLNKLKRISTRQELLLAMRVISLMVLVILTISGCATSRSVYVLDREELVKVKIGETITAKFDGYFFSNRAISRVMNTKVEDANLK